MSTARKLAVLFLFACLPLPASPAPLPTAEDIARAVRQLGDNNYQTRERASAFLWAAGQAAESALKASLTGKDREVIHRAEEILEKFKYNIYPDTPPHLVKLIILYRSSDRDQKQNSLRQLLNLGRQSYPILLKLAEAEGNPEERKEFFQKIMKEVVPLLVEGDDFAGVEKVLEAGLTLDREPSLRSYAVFWKLRNRLPEKISFWQRRLEEARDPQASEILASLYRANGDLARARPFVPKHDHPLLNSLLLDLGDWPELIKNHPLPPPTQQSQYIEALGFRAAFQRLSGQTVDFQNSVRLIHQVTENKTDEIRWHGVEALFLNDLPREAVAVLVQGQNYGPAYEILQAQSKYPEALALVEKARSGKSFSEVAMFHARTLVQLGEIRQAADILSQVAEKINPEQETSLYGQMVETEFKAGLHEKALAHAAHMLEGKKLDDNLSWLMGRLFPTKADAAEMWWKFLRRKDPGQAAPIAMKKLRDILQNHCSAKEMADLLEEAEKMVATLHAHDQEKWLETLADIHHFAGNDARALALLEQSARSNQTATSLSKWADFLADQKQWPEAARRFHEAWDKNKSQPTPLYLHGWALAQMGQKEAGAKLMDRARLLPLANDESRADLADSLSRHGLTEEARREYELLLRTAKPESWYEGNARRHFAQAAASRKDFLTAAAFYERFMLDCLRINMSFEETKAYLIVPQIVHYFRARGLTAAGRHKEAWQEIQQCLNLVPGDVDVPIDLLPELEKQGKKDEADKLFHQVYVLYNNTCVAHPHSAWAHNSLAWLAARCRRRLDDGLNHALQAAKLEPDNSGYLDTLAEVYFQKGQKSKAAEIMKRCISLDSRSPYYRKQLLRIEAGNPIAAVPS